VKPNANARHRALARVPRHDVIATPHCRARIGSEVAWYRIARVVAQGYAP